MGRVEGMKGDGEGVIGIEAREGDGGRAGVTEDGPNWTLAVIRFSISSMSDWEVVLLSGAVSRSSFDIVVDLRFLVE